MATLTYDYKDSTVVLGPLATAADPNSYDLCDEHAVVRLATNFEPAPPSGDDLLALVDAVRRAAEAGRDAQAGPPEAGSAQSGPYAARSVGAPDTSSPLDPSSPYAKRRAQFRVVAADDGE